MTQLDNGIPSVGIILPDKKEETSTEPKQIELQSSDDPEKVKVTIPNGTDSHKKKFFSNGKIDRPGLLEFIKEIRKVQNFPNNDDRANREQFPSVFSVRILPCNFEIKSRDFQWNRTSQHPGLTDEDCATLAAARLADEQAHSRGWYRVSAIRDFTGGKRTKPSISATLQHKLDQEAGFNDFCPIRRG